MKRSVLNKLGEYEKKSMGYVAELSYIYGNICVKANPTSLLDLEVVEDDRSYRIEDLAYVIVHDKEGDDDKIDIFPKNGDSDIPLLAEAVTSVHPEFEQTVEVQENPEIEIDKSQCPFEIEDDEPNHFLRLTMPVVNDDRRKVMTDGVNVAYDVCNVKLDALNTYYSAAVAASMDVEPEKEVKFVKDSLEQIRTSYRQMADQFKTDKLKEIEDAYKRYLTACQNAVDKMEEDDLSAQWKKLKLE